MWTTTEKQTAQSTGQMATTHSQLTTAGVAPDATRR